MFPERISRPRWKTVTEANRGAMDQIVLNAEVREVAGKGAARRLRTAGKVPAVVYGKGLSPVHISLNKKELSDLLISGKALRTMISLKVDGRSDFGKRTMMFKEIQRHHIKRSPIAADLHVIDTKAILEVPIPVKLVGTPVGLNFMGVMQHLARTFTVKASLENLPEVIEVDVTEVMPGDTLYIEDISLPDGVTIDVKVKTPVCTMTIPRDYEEETKDEDEEGEEGEEGEKGSEKGEKKEDSSSPKKS